MPHNATDKLTVFDTQGHPYILTRVVGQGAQGVAYEEESGDYIVKIVTATDSIRRAELSRRFRWLCNRQIPENSRLALPVATLASPQLGYVMRRVRGHQSLTLLLRPMKLDSVGEWYNASTGGLRRRLLLAAQLAASFRLLHLAGLAYCDLSDTNILVARDPRIVSLVLIDPDNISVSGKAEALVLGTPRYIAPEVLRGSHQPDSLTDTFSLAVLIFQLLRLNHPFLGDAVLASAPDAEENAYCGELPYIDHPENVSNRSTHVLPVESVCTTKLAELFNKAFVEGVNARGRRPTPGEWEDACLAAADNTTSCSVCGATFYPRRHASGSGACACPWCDEIGTFPPALILQDVVERGGGRIYRKVGSLVLRPGETEIVARHFVRTALEEQHGGCGTASFSWDTTTGDISVRNQGMPELLYRRAAGSTLISIPSGKSAALQHETVLYFGYLTEGVAVRCAQLHVTSAKQAPKE